MGFKLVLRPSKIMLEMLSLLGKKEAAFLLKHVFLKKMSPEIRNGLATFTGNLVGLGQEADKIWLQSSPSSLVNSVNAVASGSSKASQPSKPTTTGDGKTNVAKKPKLCYFHRKFREKATKCKKPCSWKGDVAAVEADTDNQKNE